MKYLVITLLLLSCKKQSNTVTWVLASGAGDVVITDGELTTDFQGCPTGWSLTREAKPNTRYTIWTNARKGGPVQIRFNGKTVATDSTFAVYKTP
jgi:hypothetical protein